VASALDADGSTVRAIAMKRTPLTRRTPLAGGSSKLTTRKALPLRSPKRAGEAAQRASVVLEVKHRDGWACRAAQAAPEVVCGGRLEVHEPIPRSAWPGVHLLADHAVAVCAAHHRWIGAHPLDAHAVGLHGFSWERP